MGHVQENNVFRLIRRGKVMKKIKPHAKKKVIARVMKEVVKEKTLRVIHEEYVEDGDDSLESGYPDTLSVGGNDVIVHGRFNDNSHQDYGSAEVIGHSISTVHHR